MARKRWGLAALAAVALLAAACGGGSGGGDDADGEVLRSVLDRGELRCGVKGSHPGFSILDGNNRFQGFDVEFCRAIAAAVLGDGEAVAFVQVPSATRFELLNTRQIDVLIRTTTVTAERDASLGLEFGPITFYTGQSFAVRADSGVWSTADMDGFTICVQRATTTEQNLSDHFNELDYDYTPLGGEDQENQDAFVAGRCDAWTGDQSNLLSRISQLSNADEFRVVDQLISKEPLAPFVIDGDRQWKDIISWVVYGLINAEELGVTRDNAEALAADPPNAAVARLLGAPFKEGAVADHGFAIDPRFLRRALLETGNYGEIYERTVATVGVPREGTLNALVRDGGVLYAPPYR